jgi:CRP-like cAMP-binding protein
MNGDRAKIIALLKNIYIFHGLDDEQIARVASLFNVTDLKKGERLYKEGALGDRFFIIQEGEVAIERTLDNGEKETTTLLPGDFFGEDALLFEQPRQATVKATEPTRLLFLDSKNFYQLLREYPEIKPNLARTVRSHRLAEKLDFVWLGEDEVIYQIRRKHEARLFISLIPPLLIIGMSLSVVIWITIADLNQFIWNLMAAIAILLFGIGVLWGIWSYFDWRNDYYIVTDQRVVWVEKVIWLYDSRQEVPLSTVLSVDVSTDLLGRALGYGTVIIRTFTGQLALRFVGEPYDFAAVVEQFWQRLRRRSEEAEAAATQQSLKRRLGISIAEEAPTPEELLKPPPPPATRTPDLWERLFGNFFKMRFEDGKVITYRKYWTILLGKVWKPTLGIIILFSLFIGYLIAFYSGYFPIFSPLGVFVVMMVFLFPLFLWWLYLYVDWRNDIYQVTDKNIFDIERRPLGTEVKKSAPLESILSLENRRQGFLGYVFNYGNVTINVGEARFVFIGVHDPASVQQDIFNRMYELRRQKELAEAERERERIVNVLSMYHRNVEDIRQEEEQVRNLGQEN